MWRVAVVVLALAAMVAGSSSAQQQISYSLAVEPVEPIERGGNATTNVTLGVCYGSVPPTSARTAHFTWNASGFPWLRPSVTPGSIALGGAGAEQIKDNAVGRYCENHSASLAIIALDNATPGDVGRIELRAWISREGTVASAIVRVRVANATLGDADDAVDPGRYGEAPLNASEPATITPIELSASTSAAWYRDPLAPENIPNSLQVGGAALAGLTFIAGAVLVVRRRRMLGHLLRAVESARRKHAHDAGALGRELRAIEAQCNRLVEKGRLRADEAALVGRHVDHALRDTTKPN